MAYRATGTVGEVNGTSVGSAQGLGMPAGMAAGDILLLQAVSRASAATIATPTGWLAHPTHSTLAFTNSHRQSWFYRVAVGGDAIPTVTQTVAGLLLCSITAFSGRDTSTIFDVVPASDGNVDALTFAAESITPVTPGCDLVWLFSTEDDNTLGTPSQGTLAYARQTTTGADASQALVYRAATTVAASGTCSLTQGANGPDNWCTFTLALRPAAAAVTDPATALFDDILFDVDVAFGAGPFTPTPTWTRVTDYVSGAHAVTVNVGRQSEDGEVNPGTCSLVLNNSITSDAGRRFDPDYAAGPYYGQLNLRTPIRVWARRDSVTHPLYTGLVQSWRQVQVAGSRDGLTEVTAIDVSSLLANTPVPATALHLAVLTDRPEVYLPLDEEEIGPIRDASGNGWLGQYPLTGVDIVDTIVVGQVGKKAKARSLIGSTGWDGTVANMTAGSLPENILALEAWVMVTDYSASLLAFGNTRPFQIDVYGVSNGIRLRFEVSNASGGVEALWLSDVIDATDVLNLGAFTPAFVDKAHHVAVTIDDNLATINIYLDGQLASSAGIGGLVRHDEPVKEQWGGVRALLHLRSLLPQPARGNLLVTVPMGCNRRLDDFLMMGAGAARACTFVRAGDGWVQTADLTWKPYGSTTIWAESVWIGEW